MPVARQLAVIVTIAAVAVTVAFLAAAWSLRQEHRVTYLLPDSTAAPVFPVCDGTLRYFPVRQWSPRP